MTLPSPFPADAHAFQKLIHAARETPAAPRDVARLATQLAESGEVLPRSSDIADVASTGGPGSLSTLLTPIFLRAAGARVVKLAVPGRPAGAIDALGSIPGYMTRLSLDELKDALARCGIAHFLADERFAPCDAKLFDYRKANGGVAIPTLAAASLLSKKLAAGVARAGLDIRVWEMANFGKSVDEATVNAKLFCEAAAELGIVAYGFVSSPPSPPQPYIGRGESLQALRRVMEGPLGPDDQWLNRHVELCLRMATTTLGAACEVAFFNHHELREVMAAHLDAQGTSWAAFVSHTDALALHKRTAVLAKADGYAALSLPCIRQAIVDIQSRTPPTPGAHFSDPGGVVLGVRDGEEVKKGQALASIRGADSDFVREVSRCITVSQQPRNIQHRDLQVIHAQ